MCKALAAWRERDKTRKREWPGYKAFLLAKFRSMPEVRERYNAIARKSYRKRCLENPEGMRAEWRYKAQQQRMKREKDRAYQSRRRYGPE